jgi:predicted dehydrogenase
MIRLGIAGLQHPHIQTIIDEARKRDDVELVALSDPDPTAHRGFDVPAYDSHQDMFAAEKIDAVGVGAVNSDRGGIIADALSAGIHVIADKPMCTTLADLDRIEAAGKSSGSILSLALEKRFYPPTLAAQGILDSGELGQLTLIAASAPHKLTRSGRPAWMFDRSRYGGIINDLAIHDLDLFLHFSGATQGEVRGYVGNSGNTDRPEFQDHGVVVVRPDDGPLATFEVHWMSPEAADYHGDYQMRLVGTEGTAELRWKDNELTVGTHVRPPRQEPLPSRQRPAQEFFDALLAGRRPQITAEASIAATRLALLAQQSAEEQTPARW